MGEMVERVAKAIYESKLFQPARASDPWVVILPVVRIEREPPTKRRRRLKNREEN